MANSRGRGPTLAKDINRKLVYQTIKQRRNTSRVEVAKLLHLNKNTVNSIVDEMLANQFIQEFGPQITNNAGRKPIKIGFNAKRKWSIGVQLTSTDIYWAVADLYAKPLASFSTPLESTSPNQVAAMLLSGIKQISAQFDLSCCIGMGIGIPGLIEGGLGKIIYSSHLGWNHVDLLSILKTQINLPIQIDHSVKLASLGELWYGAGQGLDHFIYCNFGNGVGCSLILNGALVRGATNAAGELGHIVVDPSGPLCSCGNKGCLEACINLPSMLKRIGQSMKKPAKRITLDWVLKELAANNEIVTQEFKRAGQYIGQALSYVTNLLNPKLIICDGPLMRASSFLFPIIEEKLKRQCLADNTRQLILSKSELFPLTSCIGAAASIIQTWEGELVTFESTT